MAICDRRKFFNLLFEKGREGRTHNILNGCSIIGVITVDDQLLCFHGTPPFDMVQTMRERMNTCFWA